MPQPNPRLELDIYAVRNCQKILTAEQERITRHGPDIGMDEIAVAAGVAGHLVSHLPAKPDLVAAVFAQCMACLAGDAEAACARVASGARALEEIAAFLSRVVALATDHAVKAGVWRDACAGLLAPGSGAVHSAGRDPPAAGPGRATVCRSPSQWYGAPAPHSARISSASPTASRPPTEGHTHRL